MIIEKMLSHGQVVCDKGYKCSLVTANNATKQIVSVVSLHYKHALLTFGRLTAVSITDHG